MDVLVYNGKEEKELLEKALNDLGLDESECYYSFQHTKSGLLRKEVVKLNIISVKDVMEFLKEQIDIILKGMKINCSYETKIREKQITIKMFSDNNNILIGKNGKTLSALTFYLKQLVFNKINVYPYILLDVEDYKEKQEKRLEKLAKRVAKEVSLTKVEVELENMNSYERRIIHNYLSENKKVYTESIGEEPNRHIVIKPKSE